MAKPTIVTRAGKGAALTYTELDNNFSNIKDATITIQGGTGGVNVTADLNGTITLVAGSNVTITGNNSAKTITIASSGGGGGTIQYGDQYQFAFYDLPGSDTRINNSPALFTDASDGLHLGADLDVGVYKITSVSSNVQFDKQVVFKNYTTTEQNALTGVSGMVIFNTTTNKLRVYASGAWVDLH
jgi:hypothetical protein